MTTCRVCGKVLPNSSFPRDATGKRRARWCRDCYRAKRKEWKLQSPFNNRAHKEMERKENADALQWARCHSAHIQNYVRKACDSFERRTGKEAPPQLRAIEELAAQITAEIPHVPVYPTGEVTTTCRHCGEAFTYTRTRGRMRIWCSRSCMEKAKYQREKTLDRLMVSAGQGADK